MKYILYYALCFKSLRYISFIRSSFETDKYLFHTYRYFENASVPNKHWLFLTRVFTVLFISDTNYIMFRLCQGSLRPPPGVWSYYDLLQWMGKKQHQQRGESAWGKVQGKPGIGFQESSPVGSPGTYLTLPVISYDSPCEMIPTKKGHWKWASAFYWGLVTASNFRLSGGKQAGLSKDSSQAHCVNSFLYRHTMIEQFKRVKISLGLFF